MNEKPTDYIYIPVEAALVQEIYRRRDLRQGDTINIASYVNTFLQNELDATAGDADAWDNDEYIETYWNDYEWEEEQKTYGDRAEGYMWKNLFLPNRTKLRMTYKGTVHEAEIQHQQIVFDGQTEFEGKPFSPSSLVSKIAEGTNRNAWRDIYIQRPGNRDWILADVARNA
jgi:hypothetical protein